MATVDWTKFWEFLRERGYGPEDELKFKWRKTDGDLVARVELDPEDEEAAWEIWVGKTMVSSSFDQDVIRGHMKMEEQLGKLAPELVDVRKKT